MRPDRRRPPAQTAARAAALAIACALALGACGGGDDPEEAGSTTSTTTTESTTNAAPGGPASELRERFDALVVETLTGSENLSPSVARCAVAALAETVNDADLREAAAELAETGEVPEGLIDDAYEAGRDCSD